MNSLTGYVLVLVMVHSLFFNYLINILLLFILSQLMPYNSAALERLLMALSNITA